MDNKQVIVKPNKYNKVRKAEKLIQARYKLSTLAIKIITSVISMISKDDSDFHLYVLKVQDFKDIISNNGKLGGKEYKEFIEACNELMDRRIEFDDGEEVGFMLTRWIASAEYFAGTGEVEVEISQKLKPLLLQLIEGNYLNYDLGNILALRSNYLIRLYELLKHEYNKTIKYRPNTTAVVYEIDIENFRKTFKIPNSYAYKDIRVNIFDKAVKQFKEHTDIEITWEVSRKRAKKVIAVEFTIRANDGLADYLKDFRTFVSYIRKYYINQDIWQGQGMILSVSEKGRIYDKKTTREYTKNDSQKVWEKWYELAKENKLLILRQGKLF
jgi:plasmid replication initiation protein